MSDEEIVQQKKDVLYNRVQANDKFRHLAVALQIAGEKLARLSDKLRTADCFPEYSTLSTLIDSEDAKGIAFLDSAKLIKLLTEYEAARQEILTLNKQAKLLKLD